MRSSDFLHRQDTIASLADGAATIALLDAACLFGLPERLEANRLEALCLFKGETADELRDVAPYLVRLEPNGKLLRDLLKPGNSPAAGWARRPGILLRTDMSLIALRHHLRRFLRVTHDEKPFFFRFWEAASLRAYFACLPAGDIMRQRWFHPLTGERIGAFLVPDPERDGFDVFSDDPADNAANDPVCVAFNLRQHEIDAILLARMSHDVHELTDLLARTFPDNAATRDRAAFERRVARSLSRARDFGFKQKENLFRVAAWDLHCDGQFERADPEGTMSAILRTSEHEQDKMRRLTERLAQIEG